MVKYFRKNMIKDMEATITAKRKWGNYFLLQIESPFISAEAHPGQFIMVKTSNELTPLLRRPFSIHNCYDNKLEIFFQKVGSGTSLLSKKKEGEKLDILGPLGNGFTTNNTQKRKKVVLVGGGRGIAPLYFLACLLKENGTEVIVFYGGKKKEDIPLKEKFQKESIPLFCSTDDGSSGFQGFVTTLFASKIESIKPDFVYSCGPDQMMKELAEMTLKKKIPAEFSLESIMGCGFGACWGCVKSIYKSGKPEWQKICKEGPVFPAEKIVWD